MTAFRCKESMSGACVQLGTLVSCSGCGFKPGLLRYVAMLSTAEAYGKFEALEALELRHIICTEAYAN